jgi:hypothetical protein
MTTVKTPELKPAVIAISTEMQKGITIDAKAGSSVAKEDIYEKTLPEGLTLDIATKLSDHNANFVAAGAHAFGTLAVAAMSKAPKCEKLALEVPMAGKDSVTYNIDRFKDTVNHLGNGETVRKFGVVNASVEIRAGKNGGQLKNARAIIAQLGMEALKK